MRSPRIQGFGFSRLNLPPTALIMAGAAADVHCHRQTSAISVHRGKRSARRNRRRKEDERFLIQQESRPPQLGPANVAGPPFEGGAKPRKIPCHSAKCVRLVAAFRIPPAGGFRRWSPVAHPRCQGSSDPDLSAPFPTHHVAAQHSLFAFFIFSSSATMPPSIQLPIPELPRTHPARS